MPSFGDSPFRYTASLAMILMDEVPSLSEDEAILFAAQAYQLTGDLIFQLEEFSDEIKAAIRDIQSGRKARAQARDSVLQTARALVQAIGTTAPSPPRRAEH